MVFELYDSSKAEILHDVKLSKLKMTTSLLLHHGLDLFFMCCSVNLTIPLWVGTTR